MKEEDDLVQDLIQLCKERGPKVYIQTHNFPDPDAIGSAYGLQKLLERYGIQPILCYAGRIDKLSTSRMLEEFDIQIFSYDEIKHDMKDTDPTAGMLRLVMGLGTAAVDRNTGSYPRIVLLEHPTQVMLTTSGDRHRYSQRLIDAVCFSSGNVRGFAPEDILQEIPEYLKKLLLSHDWDEERFFRERGQYRQFFYVSCEGLVENVSLMSDMRGILDLLKGSYDYDVDIEYTINIAPNGDYLIDLLQCRPLQQTKEGDTVTVPQAGPGHVFLETKQVSMGFSRTFNVDLVVYVDPIKYYQMPYREKFRVRDVLSAVNWKLRGRGKRMLLLSPGRICTSSAELGVTTAFSDISEFDMIAEISESRAGYMPELSYGSHIFQDLVEAGILYTAVFEEASTVHYEPKYLEKFENKIEEYAEDLGFLSDIVRVCETEGSGLTLYYDMAQEHLLITEKENSVSDIL